VSEPVHDSIKNQENVQVASLGVQQLRNVTRPVEVFRVTGTAPPPRASVPASRPSRRRPLWAAAAVLTLTAAALGSLWLSRPRPAGPIESIAVLPLENLSDDPEQEYFAAGMTDALISGLAKIEALRVISRTSVLRHKDTRRPLSDVARELEADAVVEGTVLRAGSRVRITAQLIDARNDVHLWSESYERDLSDILTLQAEVAQAIARAIEHELIPSAHFARNVSVNPRAYEATVRGRQFLKSMTPADHQLSVNYFKRAIAEDPSYAPAYAGLADAYT
jgi:TolB-like protein